MTETTTMPAQAQVNVDDDTIESLASFDVRNVDVQKLMAIFQCTADDLNLVRQDERYKAAYADELYALEQRALTMDKSWDAVEAKAIGELHEQLDLNQCNSPRELLNIAATANRMSRRSNAHAANGLEKQRADAHDAVIDATPNVTIRLRTKFVNSINAPAGHVQLLEREAEISAKAPDKIVDEMTAGEVRRHFTQDLGIDLNDLKTGASHRIDDGADFLFTDAAPLELDPAMFADTGDKK